MRLACVLLATFAAVHLFAQGSSAQQQNNPTPAPGQHAGVIPGTAPTETTPFAQPATKEPGDAFYFDFQNGRLVLVSRGKTFTLVVQNGAVAKIDTKYVKAGEILHYEWTLRNEARAHQGIRDFMVDTPAEFVNVDTDSPRQPGAPVGWSVFAGAKLNERGSRFFAAKSPEGPVSKAKYDLDAAHLDYQLAPGDSAGPFSIDSPNVPGLLKATVTGFKPEPREGEPSDQEVLIEHDSEQSPWVSRQLAMWMVQNNHGLGTALLIGPKLRPGNDLFEQVRSELDFATTSPEFKDIADRLSELASSSDPNGLAKALQELRAGRTGIEKQFLDAMLFDLNFVM
jgi:hypothetical protein